MEQGIATNQYLNPFGSDLNLNERTESDPNDNTPLENSQYQNAREKALKVQQVKANLDRKLNSLPPVSVTLGKIITPRVRLDCFFMYIEDAFQLNDHLMLVQIPLMIIVQIGNQCGVDKAATCSAIR